jgi:hypothetical protein
VEFSIIGEVSGEQTFASGSGIREIGRLRKSYGPRRWRKRKGIAALQLADGSLCRVELHWYEATGIGRREYKIKRFLDSYEKS